MSDRRMTMLPAPQLGNDAPWKKRYRAEQSIASLARFAPERGMVASNRSGTFELYAWDVPSRSLRQLTNRPDGTLFGAISPDGRFIYYFDDQHGNELGHFRRLPFEGGSPVDMTPSLPVHSMSSGEPSPSGRLFGLTVPTASGFDCYVVAQDDDGPVGEPRLMHHSDTLAHGPAFSRDGDLAVWAVARPGKHAFGLIAFDLSTGERCAELWEGEDASLALASFSPVSGDTQLLAAGDATGVKQPIIWDPRRETRLGLDVAGLDGEVTPWEWTPDGAAVLLCQVTHATQRLYRFDMESRAMRRLEHPEGTLANPAYFLADGTLAVRWMDSTHPRTVIVLDSETGQQVGTLLEPPAVPDGRPWRSITFPADGGVEIQAWLATPEGAGPFPTILNTHGGPTSVQLNTFAPDSQMWLDHGFAYCSVNYRGSTTFGRDLERAIWGNLGYWEVRDMVAARRYLVDEGIADPEVIFLTGWSYGGYLTLQAMGIEPDLWAGGMGGVVVADWVSQYEDENDVLRGYDVALFGGSLEEKRHQYVKSSPITYVDRLKAPVLIIQGRNDTRDPPRQVELYEARARELGKDVEVLWFETGHAGAAMNVELGISFEEEMLRFVYRVLRAAVTR